MLMASDLPERFISPYLRRRQRSLQEVLDADETKRGKAQPGSPADPKTQAVEPAKNGQKGPKPPLKK